jgi:hypothetical protein
MFNIAKRVEMGANTAIIIVAIVFAGALIRNYASSRAQNLHQIAIGTKFALQDVNWQAGDKTLIFALSTNCHYCTESAGFYRELAHACKEHHIRTIALFPQPIEKADKYIKSLDVGFDELRQTQLAGLDISGTPTLLLINTSGLVTSVWIGKLPDEAERKLLAKLTAS